MPDRPYPLTIEQETEADGGWYVVSDDVTLVYGYGETLDAALDDYDVSLAEWQEWEAMTPEQRAAWTAQAATTQAAELAAIVKTARSGGA